MVFGCSFLLFLAVFCCFLQDSTHFLPFISKILVETIISDINWRFGGENNDSNPYMGQDKKIWFVAVFADFSYFLLFFQVSTYFLSVISKILVETIISDINWRYWGENNDAKRYFLQDKKNNMVFCWFFAVFSSFICFFRFPHTCHQLLAKYW